MGKLIQFPGGEGPRPLPPTSAQRNELVEKHVDIVRMIALRVARSLPRSVDVDDLIGAGYIGLMEAAERYDESMGVPFSAYLRMRVRGAMLDTVRRRNYRETSHVSLDDVCCDDQGNDPMTASPDEEATITEDIERKRLLDRVWGAVSQLSPREQTVIRMHYGAGEDDLLAVGSVLAVHPSRASQIHTAALRKLRDMLLDDAQIMERIAA